MALAEATQEISRGRLDYRVEIRAADEIGDLVRSFNRMAEDLEASRRQIEASSRDLGVANIALERRRRHIETILESIPRCVSLDADHRITHLNHALLRMFHPVGSESNALKTLIGAQLLDLFPQEILEDLDPLGAPFLRSETRQSVDETGTNKFRTVLPEEIPPGYSWTFMTASKPKTGSVAAGRLPPPSA